jgi:hypothetical protein
LRNVGACVFLGNEVSPRYHEGFFEKLKKSKRKGMHYFGMACDYGNQGACNGYRELKEQGVLYSSVDHLSYAERSRENSKYTECLIREATSGEDVNKDKECRKVRGYID